MYKNELYPKYCSLYLSAMLLFVYFWMLNGIATAATQAEFFANRDAEEWVEDQVKAGKEADLIKAKEFPEEASRMISAKFLEDLLTDSLEGVKVHWRGVRIKNAIVAGELDLVNAEIPYETQLSSCHFKETVKLSKAIFRKSLLMVDSTFHKSANFAFAEIVGSLNADGARFKSAGQKLTVPKKKRFRSTRQNLGSGRPSAKESMPVLLMFTDMKVGGGVFFRDAIFETSVDFSYANIGGNLEADGARFMGTDQKLPFNKNKGSVRTGRNSRSRRNSAKETPPTISTFTDMKVGGGAFFRDAIFETSVDFSYADIGGNFEADRAQFMDKTDVSNFNRMKVGEQAIFRKVTFAAGVSMKDARFFDLILSLESWPRPEDSDSIQRFRLDGMTYQHISAGGEDIEELSANILKLFKRSEYSLSGYTNLEAFFQRRGEPEMADKTFIERKKREREFLGGLAWLWNLTLYVLVCYGRRPEFAFIWGALIVSVGCFVFRRKEDMELGVNQHCCRNQAAINFSVR